MESPTTTGHTIHYYSRENILCQIRLNILIKINSIIDICLPDPPIGSLNKPNPVRRLTIDYGKWTLEAGPSKVRLRNKHVFKNSQKFRDYFLRVIKIIVVTVLRNGHMKSLEILVKVSFPYGPIFSGLPTTDLIVHKKIMIFLLSSVQANVVALKTLSRCKEPMSSEYFSNKVIIFVHTVTVDIIILQEILIVENLITTQTLHISYFLCAGRDWEG